MYLRPYARARYRIPSYCEGGCAGWRQKLPLSRIDFRLITVSVSREFDKIKAFFFMREPVPLVHGCETAAGVL